MTARFKKELKHVIKQNTANEELLDSLVMRLLNDEELEFKYHDHGLFGNFYGCREFHARLDLIVIYRKIREIMVMLLMRIGSHSEIFG
jgi:mRNA interferase YafQ